MVFKLILTEELHQDMILGQGVMEYVHEKIAQELMGLSEQIAEEIFQENVRGEAIGSVVGLFGDGKRG